MGYYISPRAKSKLPRALSLFLSCQIAVGMAPIAFAQTTDASAAEQTAAPSWNDNSDLMVLPKGDSSKVETKIQTKSETKVETSAQEPVKLKETQVDTAVKASEPAAQADDLKVTAQKNAQAEKEAALKAKADAVKAKLEEAKAKLEAKKAEEQAIADAKAEAARSKAEAARLEAEKTATLKAEAAKAKLEAQKLEADKKAEAKQKAAQLKAQKEESRSEQKAREAKSETEKAEAPADTNKSLAEAHVAPAQAASQTDAAVIRQQPLTKTEATSDKVVSPLAPATTEEAVEIVDTDKMPAAGSDVAKSEAIKTETATTETVKSETSQTEAIATPQTQDSTTAATPTGLAAGSILNPDATSLMTSPQTPQVGQPIPEQPGAMTTADTLDIETAHQLGATINEVTGSANAIAGGDGEIPVLDADEQDEVERIVEYENLPTDEGKTRIKTGAKFPVVVLTQISSKTARNGDAIDARLKYDLKIGDRLIAKKGDTVRGHINYALKARSVMHSLVSPQRWYRNSGVLGVEFDEIITAKGEHLPLVAAPAKTARVVNNKAEGRLLGVNHEGQVTGPWSQQLKYKAVRVGLNAAMGPIGVFSFGAMPVALGLIGAANPSFAFMKPVGTNVRHRRIKGFAWGFLSGVPGSFLIEDTVTKGQEAIIKPGDEFLAEFKQEFTGEAASEAQLMSNAQTKVKGDVRTKDKKKDSKDSKDKSQK